MAAARKWTWKLHHWFCHRSGGQPFLPDHDHEPHGNRRNQLSSHSQIMKAMRPIEMVMVMDTTGSMATDNKIDGAKTAARNLLSTVYGGSASSVPESEYLRVALVPFAAAVRLNPKRLSTISRAGSIQRASIRSRNSISIPLPFRRPLGTTTRLGQNSRKPARLIRHGMAALRPACAAQRVQTDYNVNDVAPTMALRPRCSRPILLRIPPHSGILPTYPTALRGKNWNGTYIAEDTTTPNEVTGISAADSAKSYHRC